MNGSRSKSHSNSLFFKIPILLVIVVAAYWNSYHNQFLWDDEFLIDENVYINSFSNLDKIFSESSTSGFGTRDRFFRPMQALVYTIAQVANGRNNESQDSQTTNKKRTWPFHTLNILLHGCNTILLFLLILQLWPLSPWAFWASALWASHPIHTEAITYMSGTADPLSVLFAFFSIFLFLKWRKTKEKLKQIGYYTLSLFSFLLALLSKEAIIILPGLLMLINIFALSRPPRWADHRLTSGHWVLAFGYFLLRKTLLNFSNTFTFYETSNLYTENIHYRIMTFLATLPNYIFVLFWPADLHMERQFPVFTTLLATPVIMGLLILLISIYTIWRNHKSKSPGLHFATLWFFIVFVPMCGILIPVNSFFLEHWLYFSSMGFFISFTSGLQKTLLSLNLPKKFPEIVYSIIVISFITLTHLRNRDWKDPITFYTNILTYNSGSARIHNNLAMGYSNNELWGLAETHYIKAIQISDIYPQSHYNLARVYIHTQNYQKAKIHLKRSLELQPDFHFSQNLLLQLNQFLKNHPRVENSK